jgi:hypothetical protein
VHAPFLGGGWVTDDFQHLEYLSRQPLARVAITPDVYGYYRPLPQASLLLQLNGGAPRAVAVRAWNLVLHGCVIAAAFLLARLLLPSEGGAFLAALAFTLTPKAHTQAVLWASARPEPLMAVAALLAVAAWIRWQTSGEVRWAAASGVLYVTALLCKESAVLLPALLLFTPVRRPAFGRRGPAAALMMAAGAVVVAMRAVVGARLPVPNAAYAIGSPTLILENIWNYFTRAAPAPAVIVLLAALAWAVHRAGAAADSFRNRESARPSGLTPTVATYGLLWFLVFTAPVLPMPARSELYLYLAGFGLCLMAGMAADALLRDLSGAGQLAVVAILVAAGGAYQAGRAADARDTARFSETLAAALQESPLLQGYSGIVSLEPHDAGTAGRLKDAVGGNFDPALRVILARGDISGSIIYPGEGIAPAGLRLWCEVRGGRVVLERRPEVAPAAATVARSSARRGPRASI